jgi:hypothetical protein
MLNSFCGFIMRVKRFTRSSTVFDPITTWRLAEIRQQELLEQQRELLDSPIEARQLVYQLGSALSKLGERIKQFAAFEDDQPQTQPASEGAGD